MKADEVINKLGEILPIKHFLKQDEDGCFEFAEDRIDAADFKDHASEFVEAMILVATTLEEVK